MLNLGVQFLDPLQGILRTGIIIIFIADSGIKFLNIFINLISNWLLQLLNVLLIFNFNVQNVVIVA